MAPLRHALVPCLLVLGGCELAGPTAPGSAPELDADPGPARFDSPLVGETLLEATSEAWQASLVHDNDETGIWTVEAFDVFEEYATPELVGLDDRGRALVCVSYSGKWTPLPIIEDGAWLGGLEHGDLDPRIEGAELYTGGKNGRLFQVVAYPHGGLDYRRIAAYPGREIHTLVGGEVDAGSPGPELLVFTRPGGLFRVTADGPDGTFRSTPVEGVTGRVRDAVVLPRDSDDPAVSPPIACVSRAGWLRILRVTGSEVTWETVHEEPMGKGRLSLGPGVAGAPYVLYATTDDGRVLRHLPPGGDRAGWTTELVHVGPQGARGLAAGRFDPDPAVETLAIFGYGKRVELLRRAPGEDWTVETLFVDRDKGHWLTRAELDGRNATDELVLSGYGARMVMLARLPGTGLGSSVEARAAR